MSAAETMGDRAAMKQYWEEHTKECSVQEMMLDSQAAEIDEMERPEILGLLGDVSGRRILELGAGIGRFTAPLATKAKHVTAVDFMPHLIEENRRLNGAAHKNIDFLAEDATALELPPNSIDLFFSNWLLMYLSDAEVQSLMTRALKWTAPGGRLFFRESCFRQSGDKRRGFNPTKYRDPAQYFAMMDAASHDLGGGREARWELEVCRCVDTYVQLKQNQHQICWRARRVEVEIGEDPPRTKWRRDLDHRQYTPRGLARYQAVYGEGYIGPGGQEVTAELVGRLGLSEGQKVLDVGCGVGGAALYMAERCGVEVRGVDLSVNMIVAALSTAGGRGAKVSFEIADIVLRDLPDGAFDAVFSREALLHIPDKLEVLKKCYRCLRPGGTLLLTDYCDGSAGVAGGDEAFAGYVRDRKYSLETLQGYEGLLRQEGFTEVVAEDWTARLIGTLDAELHRMSANKQQFARQFSLEEYDAIVASWMSKRRNAETGSHRWGLFIARKPAA
ncbi:unnamed protein product [Pedinophyceae sp. YPF-701]|nr:unnamed protein product [Pedinophyceae sp. YPF-701]